jgi:hypothetical protein
MEAYRPAWNLYVICLYVLKTAFWGTQTDTRVLWTIFGPKNMEVTGKT